MMITAHGAAAAIALLAYGKVSKRGDIATIGAVATAFLFGTLPDLPLSLLVLAGRFDPALHNHHQWITHTPIFWAAVAAPITLFGSRRAGLMLLGGTWLHLAMDWYGGSDGIAFLYPFDHRLFGAGLSGVNGLAGFSMYIRQPLFLALELLVQGAFFLVVAHHSYQRFIRKRNNFTASSSA